MIRHCGVLVALAATAASCRCRNREAAQANAAQANVAPATSARPPQQLEVAGLDAGPAPGWDERTGPTEPTPEDIGSVPAAAAKTRSGLRYLILAPGAGDPPRSPDNVTIRFRAWTPDGQLFEHSRGEPSTVSLGLPMLPAGVREGLELMLPGSKYRFWIPAELGYQRIDKPSGPIVYEIELLGHEPVKGPQVIPAPADVAKVPTSAARTASGLASRVLQGGHGSEHPGPTDKVTLHFTGWTPEGRMFASSVAAGEPRIFQLNQEMPGWLEGIQLMVIGEKRRFWIPSELAFGKPPEHEGVVPVTQHRPTGMVVYDIELRSIDPTAP